MPVVTLFIAMRQCDATSYLAYGFVYPTGHRTASTDAVAIVCPIGSLPSAVAANPAISRLPGQRHRNLVVTAA